MTDDREQKVRERAYSLWEQNGGEHGRHEEHWQRAEAELDDEGDAGAPSREEPAEGGEGTPAPGPGSPEQR